jgi:hypothetical protein
MRAVIIVLLIGLCGCFPHNQRHRRIAKLSEGGAVVAGIALLSVAGSGADCMAGPASRDAYDDCRTRATIVGNVGLSLILAGLLGFTITTVTTPDEPAPAPLPTVAKPTTPKQTGQSSLQPR